MSSVRLGTDWLDQRQTSPSRAPVAVKNTRRAGLCRTTMGVEVVGNGESTAPHAVLRAEGVGSPPLLQRRRLRTFRVIAELQGVSVV